MADPIDPNRTDGAPPKEIHLGPSHKSVNWLAWILLGLGLLALLLALSRCDRKEVVTETTATTVTPVPPVDVPADDTVVAATTGASIGELDAYLQGSDAAPRTFTFDNLNFDTAKAEIRDADRATVDKVAEVLARYPATRVRIAGYADARGNAAANLQLGRDRAEALKAALVAKGIDAGRVDTVSGGENDPVAANTTASGEAENRRTELVVLNR